MCRKKKTAFHLSVQLDNEITGTHIWAGTLDYNPQTWGFGKEDGEYAKYLTALYGSIENVNAAYNTSWKSFSEAYPLQRDAKSVYACRSGKDMFDFYLLLLAKYHHQPCSIIFQSKYDTSCQEQEHQTQCL